MKRLGTEVFEKEGYKVCAYITRGANKKRLSAKIYTCSPADEMSGYEKVAKTKIEDSSDALGFLMDMDGDFDGDDIENIRKEVLDLFGYKEGIGTEYDQASPEELHRVVCEYIREYQEDIVTENVDAPVFIQGNYGYIQTTYLKEFLSLNKDLNYQRKEMLETLQIMGALLPDEKNGKRSHSYDVLKSIKGKKKRFYRFQLLEEECEEIEDFLEA